MNTCVYIIILNWNGANDTIECLESVQQLNYKNYKIVLVENGSDDDSLERISLWAKNSNLFTVNYEQEQAERGGANECEKKLAQTAANKKLVIIDNKENLGFAAGANVGIRYALSSGSDYVWLLNNDTITEKDTLCRLINSFSENENYKGITPKIVHYETPDIIWSAGCDFTWYGKLKRYLTHDVILKKGKVVFPVSFITNCASVYPVDLFKEVGVLSEDNFMGEDDYEFSMRLNKYSYKLACNNNALVYHKIGQSTKSAHIIGSNYAEYLTRLISIKKHYSIFIWLLWLLFFDYRILVLSISNKNMNLIKCFKLIKLLTYNSSKFNKCNKNMFFGALDIQNNL